jgi:hypothetical protein
LAVNAPRGFTNRDVPHRNRTCDGDGGNKGGKYGRSIALRTRKVATDNLASTDGQQLQQPLRADYYPHEVVASDSDDSDTIEFELSTGLDDESDVVGGGCGGGDRMGGSRDDIMFSAELDDARQEEGPSLELLRKKTSNVQRLPLNFVAEENDTGVDDEVEDVAETSCVSLPEMVRRRCPELLDSLLI